MDCGSVRRELERITHRAKWMSFIQEAYGDVETAREHYKKVFLECLAKEAKGKYNEALIACSDEDKDFEICRLIQAYAGEVYNDYIHALKHYRDEFLLISNQYELVANKIQDIERKHPEWKGKTPGDVVSYKCNPEDNKWYQPEDQKRWIELFNERELIGGRLKHAGNDYDRCCLENFYLIPCLFETKEEYQARVHSGDGPNGTHRILRMEYDEENSYNN